jgi:hypothetical protein
VAKGGCIDAASFTLTKTVLLYLKSIHRGIRSGGDDDDAPTETEKEQRKQKLLLLWLDSEQHVTGGGDGSSTDKQLFQDMLAEDVGLGTVATAVAGKMAVAQVMGLLPSPSTAAQQRVG